MIPQFFQSAGIRQSSTDSMFITSYLRYVETLPHEGLKNERLFSCRNCFHGTPVTQTASFQAFHAYSSFIGQDRSYL